MERFLLMKGEIKPKFFKVVFYEPDSWGYVPTRQKYFKDLESARKYAKILLKELKELAKSGSLDYEYIEITDEKDNSVELWRNENCQIIHYPNNW
jgi:hypothetical protein